jgi:hypothetical protein
MTIPAIAGAAIPALIGLLANKGGRQALFGQSSRDELRTKYLPQQQQILNQIKDIAPNALGYYRNLYNNDQASYDQFAAPFRRQQEQYVLPQLISRFGQFGGSGIERSGGFQRAVADSFAQNEADIFANRQQMQGNALSGFLGLALGDQRYQFTRPRQSGAIEELIKLLAKNTNLSINIGNKKTSGTTTATGTVP